MGGIKLVLLALEQGLSPDAAQARALENDLPNAKSVCDAALPADVVFLS